MSTRSSREGSTEISVLPYSPQGSTRYGNSRGIYGSSSFCKNYFAWEEDRVHAEYITHIRASPEGDALGADGMCTCLAYNRSSASAGPAPAKVPDKHVSPFCQHSNYPCSPVENLRSSDRHRDDTVHPAPTTPFSNLRHLGVRPQTAIFPSLPKACSR